MPAPLVRLSTRLNRVLTAANNMKGLADQTILLINKGPLPVSHTGLMQNRINNVLNNIIATYENDEDLAKYADVEFATTFGMTARIAGMKTMLLAIGAELIKITAPNNPSAFLPDNTIRVNGEKVPVPPLTPEQTKDLKVLLQTLSDAVS